MLATKRAVRGVARDGATLGRCWLAGRGAPRFRFDERSRRIPRNAFAARSGRRAASTFDVI